MTAVVTAYTKGEARALFRAAGDDVTGIKIARGECLPQTRPEIK